MKFNIEKIERNNGKRQESYEFDNINNTKHLYNRRFQPYPGVFDGCAFNKHYRNHTHNPAGQFPMKSKGIQKRMSYNSTQQSGQSHCEKIDFEVKKYFFTFP